MGRTYLKGSQLPLSQQYALALLDLDGVVYKGAQPIKNAANAIQQASAQGMKVAYTTNNPSRYPAVVAEQLRSFGIQLQDRQVITSAIVGAQMLRQYLPAGSKVLVIGAEHLCDEVRAQGMEVVHSSSEEPQAVIQSWYPDLNLNDLAQAAYALEHGARYFVTNKDLTIPREEGIAPGNGAMQLPVIAASGKEPEDSAGKPEPGLYDVARKLFGTDDNPVSKQEALAIGDRLDTDIEAAYQGGYDSAIVLTGVAKPEDIIRAQTHMRPSYILTDLMGLAENQPQPYKTEDGSWVCGAATAKIEVGKIVVKACDSAGQPVDALAQIDALRACACAYWEASDAGEYMENIDIPNFHFN